MGRKRSVQFDYICRRCLCPCNPPWQDQRHVGGGGGGRGAKACGKPPVPVLRSELQKEMDQFAADVTAALRRPRYTPPAGG